MKQLHQAIYEYAIGKRKLQSLEVIDSYMITDIGTHTVQYITVDNYLGAIQIPFIDQQGYPTVAYRKMLLSLR